MGPLTGAVVPMSAPSTQGIDHLGLTVSDIELSRHLFVEWLGWPVVGDSPGYTAVFVSDGYTRLTLWQVDDQGSYIAFDRGTKYWPPSLVLTVASEADPFRIFELVQVCRG